MNVTYYKMKRNEQVSLYRLTIDDCKVERFDIYYHIQKEWLMSYYYFYEIREKLAEITKDEVDKIIFLETLKDLCT